MRQLFAKAKATIFTRKQKKLDAIMRLLDTRSTYSGRAGRVTNDEVEKLLHVSDATATRYLAQLEKEGRVVQVGKGAGAYYVKN